MGSWVYRATQFQTVVVSNLVDKFWPKPWTWGSLYDNSSFYQYQRHEGLMDPIDNECDVERLCQCSLLISRFVHVGGSPAVPHSTYVHGDVWKAKYHIWCDRHQKRASRRNSEGCFEVDLIVSPLVMVQTRVCFVGKGPIDRNHPRPPAGLTAGLRLRAGLTLPDLASEWFLLSFSRRTRRSTNSLLSPSVRSAGKEPDPATK